jgi:hypothetical protein
MTDFFFRLWQVLATLRDLTRAVFAVWYSFLAESPEIG